MIIRDAINKDISKIAQVHVDTWRTTYQGILLDDILENLSYEKRENSWHQVFENAQKNGNFTYVAEDKLQQIVGFANGGIERTGDPFYRGELNAIYILKSHQQKGIGRELVRVIVEKLNRMEIHSMLVWVLKGNPASYFYEKLGGKKIYQKDIQRGETKLIEIAYGWKDISILLDSSHSE